MRKRILRIFVALLTFTIGVVAGQLFLPDIKPLPAQQVELLPQDTVEKVVEDYHQRCYESLPPAPYQADRASMLYLDDKGNLHCTGEFGERRIKIPNCQ